MALQLDILHRCHGRRYGWEQAMVADLFTRLWLRFWADLAYINRRNTGKRRVAKSKGNVKHRNYR